MEQLAPRLAAVAGFVLPGGPVADIGTDHAYLPVALLAAGVVPRAVATDLRPGPLAAARDTVAAARLTAGIDLRLGDGLAVLAPGEVATVVLAGMGGPLIADLLAAALPAVLAGVWRLVLQPMAGEDTLRRRLPAMGWRIADEALALEAGRIYPVIAADPAPAGVPVPELAPMDALLGPVLRRRGGKLFAAYGLGIAQRLARAAQAAQGARSAAGQERQAALQRLEAQVLEEVKPWA